MNINFLLLQLHYPDSAAAKLWQTVKSKSDLGCSRTSNSDSNDVLLTHSPLSTCWQAVSDYSWEP
ncbi:MAG: hypothetical protein KGZ88_21770 [Methylomicrobium sp.]|nr:hypothetical protein [Methylomicrobium sp.]